MNTTTIIKPVIVQSAQPINNAVKSSSSGNGLVMVYVLAGLVLLIIGYFVWKKFNVKKYTLVIFRGNHVIIKKAVPFENSFKIGNKEFLFDEKAVYQSGSKDFLFYDENNVYPLRVSKGVLKVYENPVLLNDFKNSKVIKDLLTTTEPPISKEAMILLIGLGLVIVLLLMIGFKLKVFGG